MFNTHSIIKKTTLAFKLFLISKRKLHEVKCQPQFLCSFAFWKVWIERAIISFLKKCMKEALGTEGNTTVFLCYQVNCHKGFTFTTIRCNLQLNSTHFNFWCEKFEGDELRSVWMQVSKWFFSLRLLHVDH